MDIASEYRYRNPVLDERDLVIGISQSGETADTLAAMRLARERGAKVLAITNIMGSQATRDSDGVLFTRAGLEIGVAATKTFVAQVAAMYLFALKLAQVRGTLEPEVVRRLVERAARACRTRSRRCSDAWTTRCARSPSTGRTPASSSTSAATSGLPVCLEGALKLKEISYIPTDAYAAGEMKHGPIALLDERTPGRVRGDRLAGARQGALEHRRGARARRPRDRRRHRGLRPRGRARRGGGVRAAHRLAPPADPGA